MILKISVLTCFASQVMWAKVNSNLTIYYSAKSTENRLREKEIERENSKYDCVTERYDPFQFASHKHMSNDIMIVLPIHECTHH